MVAVLAVGIGANTAVFSLLDAVLLKPLPYPDADRLVMVLEASPAKNEKESLIAPARLENWNRMNRTFDALSASYAESVTDTSGSQPERLAARRVSPRYFAVFRAKPVAGRTFTSEEEIAGGPQSTVISYGLASRRYGQPTGAIGQRLILGGKGFSIVGVMPKNFASPTIELWIPAQIGPNLMGMREARFLGGAGRMKPGVTVAQAQEDLARIQMELGHEFPQTDKGWSAVVRDLKETRVGHYRQALFFVFGAVGLLLLIAVANSAGLMLTQLQRREKELAIRSSIGATRGQVVSGVMREVMLLALAGVGLGYLLAASLVDLLPKIFTELSLLDGFQLDWRALSFAAFAGAVAAMLSGLLPALQSTRVDTGALLAQAGRGVSGGRNRWQRTLVAGQIAITLLLLASAGLMLRSYYNLSHVKMGFNPGGAITFHVGAAWDEDRNQVAQLQQTLVTQLERIPGVYAAGFSNFLPASGATLRYQLTLEGIARTEESGKITTGERSITRGYLKALGAPLLAGQPCPELSAMTNAPPKALVNRRFAELYGKGQGMVGRHFYWSQDSPVSRQATEIVGVVGDMREDYLNTAPTPYVYVCIAPGGWPDPEYVVRTQKDPRALVQAIRPLVHDADSTRAVFGLKSLDDVLSATLEHPRINASLVTVFALAAMLLASVGLYSLVALVVTARTREIGVRMTLGAEPGQIVRQLIGGVTRLLSAGIAAGLILTLMADRALRSLLFGVSPMDAISLAAAVMTLVAVAAIATFVPARRAASIDPLQAIRSE